MALAGLRSTYLGNNVSSGRMRNCNRQTPPRFTVLKIVLCILQTLKSKLLKAAKECSYVDPHKVEEILVGCETSSAAAASTLLENKAQVTGKVVLTREIHSLREF